MRIPRIDTHDSLYVAPIRPRTVEAFRQVILNPTHFSETPDADTSKATGDLKFAHIDGYGDFLSNISKDANRVNSPKNIKGR